MPVKKSSVAIIPVAVVQQQIRIIRGQRVLLDADLARLYGVTTKQLNQAVKRNADRFPEDFMFQLTWEETDILRSQTVTLNDSPGDRPPNMAENTREMERSLRSQIVTLKRGTHVKYRPIVFTEHGVLMVANVLRSVRASKASVFIVRAFVKLRELLATHHHLAAKLDELERKLQDHDQQFVNVFDAIRQIMEESDEDTSSKPPIGYHTELGIQRKRLSRLTSPKRT